MALSLGPLQRATATICRILPVMASPQKRKVSGGRVTAKGTQPTGQQAPVATPYSSGYVPGKVSPMWVPVLMFGLLILGALMIIFNYMNWVPGGTSNWYLLGGLGLILAGIVTATQFH